MKFFIYIRSKEDISKNLRKRRQRKKEKKKEASWTGNKDCQGQETLKDMNDLKGK